ncbi:MAG: LytR/AlgR family response regulator transcription factor [Spirosomataceae bacterium]
MKKYFTKPSYCDPNLLWFEHGKLSIQPDEVVYLSSLENYTKFHLSGGRVLISSRTMKLHQEQLNVIGQNFARIHRKFLLNLKYLNCIEESEDGHVARLSTGEEIIVSRRKAKILAA